MVPGLDGQFQEKSCHGSKISFIQRFCSFMASLEPFLVPLFCILLVKYSIYGTNMKDFSVWRLHRSNFSKLLERTTCINVSIIEKKV